MQLYSSPVICEQTLEGGFAFTTYPTAPRPRMEGFPSAAYTAGEFPVQDG